jgi:ABC-type multidrug transport system fused ATPase/permease subunit
VLQDVFIFSRDIRYNIRLGADDIPEERLRAAAARVGADAFIARLPGVYGELREQGTHAELLQRDGLYARLYELQFAPLPLRGAPDQPATRSGVS